MAVLPEIVWKLPVELIEKLSKKHKLNKYWVSALVLQESYGLKQAIRYEPHYKWLYFPRDFAETHNISVETETILQKTSYGYGQIMGATARSECGYKGKLQRLVDDHELSLDLALCFLKKKLVEYGEYRKALAAYNAGSVRYKKDGVTFVNQRYVDLVYNYYLELNN